MKPEFGLSLLCFQDPCSVVSILWRQNFIFALTGTLRSLHAPIELLVNLAILVLTSIHPQGHLYHKPGVSGLFSLVLDQLSVFNVEMDQYSSFLSLISIGKLYLKCWYYPNAISQPLVIKMLHFVMSDCKSQYFAACKWITHGSSVQWCSILKNLRGWTMRMVILDDGSLGVSYQLHGENYNPSIPLEFNIFVPLKKIPTISSTLPSSKAI